MKALLNKGDINLPKRTAAPSGMVAASPSPERRNTIGRSANAAGFNATDAPEPAVVRRMTLVQSTSGVVDYGDSKPKDPSSAMPAPVQSRVVF